MTHHEGNDTTALVERAQQTNKALDLTDANDMAKALVASKFFPNVETASQALVKIQLGRELGFGPVASMMGIHVWTSNNRTSVQLSANMIANLIRRSPDYDFELVAPPTKTECRIRFLRRGKVIGESEFTIQHATDAGLTSKDVWKHHPRNMLFAAAMRNGAKWFCPEVLLGGAVPVSALDNPALDADETDTPLDFDPETGEIFEGEAIEQEEVPVVHEPPEGYKPNWSEFWTVARQEFGWSHEQVHAHFGVAPDNGALKDYAEARAAEQGKTLAQVVGEMLEQVREAHPAPATEPKTAGSDSAASDEDAKAEPKLTPLKKQPDGTYAPAATEDEWQDHLRDNPPEGDAQTGGRLPEKQAAMIPDAQKQAHP
jgi:hypothetical protein